MSNKSFTKRALLSSVMALILCVSMLVGTTFAWFTDEVVSANNVIKSGTLNIDFLWADGTKAVPTATEDWNDAAAAKAIFDYDLWEPGYTEVRHIKIANTGTLALKYELKLVANGVVSKLADVIDVYYVDPAKAADRTLDGFTKIGTLNEVIANLNSTTNTASGVLYPAGNADNKASEDVVTIALKMQESANNDYQDLSIGSDFSLKLFATQFTYEEDSFDELYDEDATYDAVPNASVTFANQYVGEENKASLNWNSNYSAVQDATLEVAYEFALPEAEEDVDDSPYATWLADFAVSFDRDITAADGLGLAGEYGSWGWIGYEVNDDIIDVLEDNGLATNGTFGADTVVDLLGTAGFPVSYSDLQLLFGSDTFLCGAWAGDNLAEDLTMTVELRLYETYTAEECYEKFGYSSVNEKTGEYVTIGTYSYTFSK